jgi:hypothetical protein
MQTQPEGPIAESEADKKDPEFAKEFWTLGNVVTGFFILHALPLQVQLIRTEAIHFCAPFGHRSAMLLDEKIRQFKKYLNETGIQSLCRLDSLTILDNC